MKNVRLCFLVLSIAALGACAAPEGADLDPTMLAASDDVAPSALDPKPPTTPGPPNPCLVQAADVSGTFGPNEAVSYYGTTSTAYASTPCGALVIDLHVPSTHTAPEGYFPDFTFASYSLAAGPKDFVAGATAENCKDSYVRVAYYKKAAGSTSWRTIGGGLRRGVWDSYGTGSCRISAVASYDFPGFHEAPASGTDVYRVAVAVKYKGAFSGVAMTAKHERDEPQ